MEKLSIQGPYGRDLEPEAGYLRRLRPGIPIRMTWVLTNDEKVVGEDPLDPIERGALIALLERAAYHDGRVEVQIRQGAHRGRVPRRDVPLAEVAWIHLEVGE